MSTDGIGKHEPNGKCRFNTKFLTHTKPCANKKLELSNSVAQLLFIYLLTFEAITEA